MGGDSRCEAYVVRKRATEVQVQQGLRKSAWVGRSAGMRDPLRRDGTPARFLGPPKLLFNLVVAVYLPYEHTTPPHIFTVWPFLMNNT